ncbi:uncharacterized protein LOC129609181 isoform X2 [Condylostylus longicornis]|nr:uncharacterized protein LOC129609181 isoform X2 [Condylostylus longicornis]
MLIQTPVFGEDKTVKKRQIYREQVLPHAGGKIPDTAFQTDRLLLNQLQKEGIAIPDGVVLEQRNPQVHPYTNKASRTVFRVASTSDARFIPDIGRYTYKYPPSLETTYLYPQIHNYPLMTPPLSAPKIPKYRPLTLPSPLLSNNPPKVNKKTVYLVSYGPKDTSRSLQSAQIASNSVNPIKSINTVNIVNNPLNGFSWSEFQQDYLTAHLFNGFDDIFNNDYQLREIRSSHSKATETASKEKPSSTRIK